MRPYIAFVYVDLQLFVARRTHPVCSRYTISSTDGELASIRDSVNGFKVRLSSLLSSHAAG